jgi:hypothetical protein
VPRLPGTPPGRFQQSIARRRESQVVREHDDRVDHLLLEWVEDTILGNRPGHIDTFSPSGGRQPPHGDREHGPIACGQSTATRGAGLRPGRREAGPGRASRIFT